ncbi:hypothetical protein M9Y10_032215 [Tritrichomonas musculus]|uniref:Uncharacterized protein n=1 Tax=Tritrichomonas musculus TaxID=1915356 RepID=A0ABR2H060_9EUKA
MIIPYSVTSISDGAFFECVSLEQIVIPSIANDTYNPYHLLIPHKIKVIKF